MHRSANRQRGAAAVPAAPTPVPATASGTPDMSFPTNSRMANCSKEVEKNAASWGSWDMMYLNERRRGRDERKRGEDGGRGKEERKGGEGGEEVRK